MIRGFAFLRSFSVRVPDTKKILSTTAAVACILIIAALPANSAQVLLEPMTTGTYDYDWNGNVVNQSWGFDELAPILVGAHQKGTFTRNYRSYMTFDTQGSQSAILSATLDLTVDRRMTDTLTNPLSSLEITLGLPRQFTAQQIADPAFSAQPPHASDIYADLATNGFTSFVIPFGDVVQPNQNGDVNFTLPLPLAFIAAFNQARTTTRYLTVSFFGGDFGMFSAEIATNPRLVVNNLTPVPEPAGLICLATGLATFAVRRKLRERNS